jgi:hypothetical protein
MPAETQGIAERVAQTKRKLETGSFDFWLLKGFILDCVGGGYGHKKV